MGQLGAAVWAQPIWRGRLDCTIKSKLKTLNEKMSFKKL